MTPMYHEHGVQGVPNDVTRLVKKIIASELQKGAPKEQAVEFALHYLQNLVIQLASTNLTVREALKSRILIFEKILSRRQPNFPPQPTNDPIVMPFSPALQPGNSCKKKAG